MSNLIKLIDRSFSSIRFCLMYFDAKLLVLGAYIFRIVTMSSKIGLLSLYNFLSISDNPTCGEVWFV